MTPHLDRKQIEKPSANIHTHKIRVRVLSTQEDGETFEKIGDNDWPLNHFFYLRHKDDGGKETVYKLIALCPDCGDSGSFYDRCPAKTEDPI